MVAHDKGKPAVRWGRKAVSLYKLESYSSGLDSREIVWLPKAIQKIAETSVGILYYILCLSILLKPPGLYRCCLLTSKICSCGWNHCVSPGRMIPFLSAYSLLLL